MKFNKIIIEQLESFGFVASKKEIELLEKAYSEFYQELTEEEIKDTLSLFDYSMDAVMRDEATFTSLLYSLTVNGEIVMED